MLETPKRDRRAEQRAATRSEILEAAWALVAVNGLAGLSLRDLAQAVGMRAPSLYSYFDSKHAIYDAMFAQGAREYVAQQARVPTTGDAVTDLEASLDFYMAFCRANPARHQLLFQRTIPGFVPSEESFAVAVQGLEAARRRLHAYGITDDSALDLVTAIGSGLTSQQIANDPDGDRWSKLIRDAAEMFYEHQSRKHAHQREDPA
jgi:AcrR family transcriptional regulator